MNTVAALIIAQIAPVPDSGVTGYLLGVALVSLGLVARLLKNRKG